MEGINSSQKSFILIHHYAFLRSRLLQLCAAKHFVMKNSPIECDDFQNSAVTDVPQRRVQVLCLRAMQVVQIHIISHALNVRNRRNFCWLQTVQGCWCTSKAVSDGSHFHLCGYVNKGNYRYWRDEQPHHVFEKLLNISKVTVWFGASAFGITGPYSFEEWKCASTVNSARHQARLETWEEDADDGDRLSRSVPLSTHHVNQPIVRGLAYVSRHHQVLLTSPGQPVSWPLNSWLPSWGYLEARTLFAYTSGVGGWGVGWGLKDHIRVEFRAINKDLFITVTVNS
jgi:hypothetical protein